jgi:hypothetical protein
LPVVSYDDALRTVSNPINDTYIFSSNGARWLFVLSWSRVNTVGSGFALIYVFKIQENNSALTLRTDIKPVNISASSSIPNFCEVQIQQVDFAKNYMVIVVNYSFSTIGSLEVNLGLEINVFQESYIMLSNVSQAGINLKTSVIYP